MPAQKKYLSGRFQRFLKITAGFIGGYLVASGFHLMLAILPGCRDAVLLSSTFTLFLLWAVLMLPAFLARNGWKIWGIYLTLAVVFFAITYQFKL